MITVNVNNTPHNFKKESSIESLLEQLDISEKGIAIAINNTIVPKPNWKQQQLSDGENVLIIKATQGG